ncbi:MAG TPA: hypothetical protein VFJ57_01305 [Solirubrobacterales bacterium]|nr:hypothetical protein [Solirubrobacterales bacterium]
MPVRDFAAGGVVRTAVGAANPSGALTMVALVKFKDTTDWMIARQASSHVSAGTWAAMGLEGTILRLYPGGDAGLTPPTGEWLLVAISKPSGSSAASYHYYRFATTTWAHETDTTPWTAAYGGVPAEIQLGRWNGGEQFNGRYAAAAVYGSALSQGAVEALVTASSIEDWLAGTPLALWTFHQASVEEGVADLTGNGADQISIEGTTVAEEEPPIPYFPPAESLIRIRVSGIWKDVGEWGVV